MNTPQERETNLRTRKYDVDGEDESDVVDEVSASILIFSCSHQNPCLQRWWKMIEIVVEVRKTVLPPFSSAALHVL